MDPYNSESSSGFDANLNENPSMVDSVQTSMQAHINEDPNVTDEKLYAKRVFEVFDPYKWFMYSFLRFPLQGRREKDGSYVFYYNKSSIIAIGFLVTSCIIGIVTVLCCFNTLGALLDFPAIQPHDGKNKEHRKSPIWGNRRFEEEFFLRRNIIPIIILLTCLFHATVGSWQLFHKRYFTASYLTFWTEAVEIVRMDVASGLRRYMMILMGSYSIFLIIFTILCLMRFAPVASGGPAVVTILSLRCFYPAIHTSEYFWVFRGFGGVLFLYILICSKAFMFFFVLMCQLMKNAFVVWNHRLDRVLHRGEDEHSQEEKLANRTRYDLLFKDHVALLDLLEGADALFSNIIESYYGSQVVSVVFEVYYFYKSQATPEEFSGARKLDAIIITLYLIHSLVILFLVSIAAAEVGEEAMDGLEVLRRKGMMGKKDEDELYFMISMYTSYTGHFDTALTGGRYFTLDKGFLVGMTGTIFSYFIILIQFSPALTIPANKNKIVTTYNISRLLNHLEGTYNFGLAVGLLKLVEHANPWNSTTALPGI